MSAIERFRVSFNANYHWYVLALAMLTLGLVGLERMCMPVLFKEISVKLNLSVFQVGTIWGLDPLAGVLVSLPAGLLADRFGVRRTLAAFSLLAGIFCAVRGFSTNFPSLAVTTFFFGLTVAFLPNITPKVTMIWFKNRRLSLANGLMQVSWSVGAVIASMFSATILSPWLGGWQRVLLLFGAPALIISTLWILTGRDREKSPVATQSQQKVPLLKSISTVARIKDIWIIGFMQFTLLGAFMGLGGYMSLYLKNMGWSVARADGVVTSIGLANMVGIIPMVYLADRLHARKRVLFVCLLGLILSYSLLPFVHDNWVYIVISTGAFLWAGASPLYITLIQETKGVGSTYAGTAVGLAASLAMLGGCLGPPIGNSLASISASAPIFFWAGLVVAGLPFFLFLKKRDTRQAPVIKEPVLKKP